MALACVPSGSAAIFHVDPASGARLSKGALDTRRQLGVVKDGEPAAVGNLQCIPIVVLLHGQTRSGSVNVNTTPRPRKPGRALKR